MASGGGQTHPVTEAGDDHPLRRLRRRRGLTQVELAGLAGLSCSASAFSPLTDDIAVARHRELAAQFMSQVSRGDTYVTGAWLRHQARDPGVNPWRLLDQLTAPDTGLSALHSRPPGGSGTHLILADSAGRGAGWMTPS